MAEPTADQRRTLAKMGVAMSDGSYYIRNVTELEDAVHAVGRATPNAGESDVARRNAVRRHIIKRANALNLTDKIPDNWNGDGSLKHGLTVEEVLARLGTDSVDVLQHFGVKGMHWGVRRSGASGGSSGPVSSDAARAHASQATIKRHGTSAVSNADLQHLVTRKNLERQYNSLNQGDVSRGRKVTNALLKEGSHLAQQEAKNLAFKYARRGAEEAFKFGVKSAYHHARSH